MLGKQLAEPILSKHEPTANLSLRCDDSRPNCGQDQSILCFFERELGAFPKPYRDSRFPPRRQDCRMVPGRSVKITAGHHQLTL